MANQKPVMKTSTRHLTPKQFAKFLPIGELASNLRKIATELGKYRDSEARGKVHLSFTFAVSTRPLKAVKKAKRVRG